MVRPKSFDEIADLVSDGNVVDWDQAERDVDPAERSWVRNLRVIGDIARMARTDDPGSLLPGVLDATSQMLPTQERTSGSVRSDASGSRAVGGDAPGEGDAWGPLRLLEKVGSGSFGDVHRAWDPMLNRQVALKLLNERASELPDAGQRVLEEARLLAKVEHPNVARIYGIEEHDNRLGIWMEFVEGTDLASVLLERGRFDVIEAAKLGAELCGALAAVHANNVIHKDVKAQNVMMRKDGRLVLMDFGAGRVRRMREGDREIVVTGTPRYMAPETFRREPATPQSDLYSVGVLLYNLVTGDFPVSGTVPEIIAAHEKTERVPLRERIADLPDGFVEIVEKALAPRREDRFASAQELEQALFDFVAEERARRAGPGDRTPAPRRSRARWIGATVALAAAVAVAVIGLSVPRAPGPLEADIRFTGSDMGSFVQFEKGDEVGPGTQLELKIKLNRPAFVYVLNRDAEGATTLLYPMANAGEHEPLAAGVEHVLPGEIEGDRARWPIGGPAGAERFLVVASVEPLPTFERSLQNVAQLDASQFGERTIDQLALNALGEDALPSEVTRGVSGLVRASDDAMDVFAVAEMVASEGSAGQEGKVFLYHLKLENTGP